MFNGNFDAVGIYDPNDKEIVEGVRAFDDGKLYTDCPYKKGSRKEWDWQEGWDKQKSDTF